MLDYIAKGFLLFSDGLIIIPLIIIGLICLDHETFYHATCLVLLSILINVSLKISFQIPLSASLGKSGYAFPSGHMQLVTVLYTWLALRFNNNWLRGTIVVLLIGIGLSLMYFGYHNFYDVAAGVVFGLLLVFLYYFLNLKWSKNMPWFILCLATLLLIYIHMRSILIATHVWMAYYVLWGFIIAGQITKRKAVARFRSNKLLVIFLYFIAIAIIYVFFHHVLGPSLPNYIYQMQWLFIGFIIPWVNLTSVMDKNQV